MKKLLFIAIAFGVFAITFSSCKQDEGTEPTPSNTTGNFDMKVDYQWAMQTIIPFELNKPLYHPMSGDTLTYTTFKHYISNIRLKKADGSYWTAPKSYHLMNAADTTTLKVHFTNVPTGEYVAMELTLGVDSAANVSGAQSGDLDPINEMFWSWNSGYIMIKAEGTSPQSGTGNFAYHLGGFSGDNSTVSVRELQFPSAQTVTINQTDVPVIHVLANPARLFHSYGSVSNGEDIHMPGAAAAQMAEDFNSWVRISQVQ